jgi:thiol-disulfide isomerase/thioredoxin
MKSLLSLVVPAFLSASLFAAAPQAPRPLQAPAVLKTDEASETTTARKPSLSILVISKSGCVPCVHLTEELKAHGDDLAWDVWKDSPRMEAKYGGVTAYPTILLLKDGKEVARRVGYTSVEELSRWVDDPTALAGGSGDYCEKAAIPQPAAISRYYAPAPFCQT